VVGVSKNWIGVYGETETSVGLQGISKGRGGVGIWGETTHAEGGAGIVGISKKWVGAHGIGTEKGGHGVFGEAQHPQGGAGVIGKSKNWIGVHGESEGPQGIGVYGRAPLSGIAGFFEGEIHVTKDIKLLNADCAEDFDIDESELMNVEAGTVMVLNEKGSLQPSYKEYDKKVAGITSGAEGYQPAIVLDRQRSQNTHRLPIALLGKTYCKVDATCTSIETGDLLTTSSTKGYAMKADDPVKAFGAVIGKALSSLKEELGMIPVLVTLQ
jgi:hypothetical protein